MARHRFRRITFIDGPLAGKWITASVVVPGNKTFRALTECDPGRQAVHLYQLKGMNEATWVRRMEVRDLYGGPGLAVRGERTLT